MNQPLQLTLERSDDPQYLCEQAMELGGWTPESLIGVLCEYLRDQQDGEALVDFLNERLAAEAVYGGDTDA